MFEHTTKIRVRYGETDQMGYMYYGNYAEFYEVGRVEMLRSLGMTYSGMEASGIMMPVLEMSCKYLKPALYDEEISVKVIMAKMPWRKNSLQVRIVQFQRRAYQHRRNPAGLYQYENQPALPAHAGVY